MEDRKVAVRRTNYISSNSFCNLLRLACGMILTGQSSYHFFFKLGLTTCKTGQPLQGFELYVKEVKKKYKRLKHTGNPLERTYILSNRNLLQPLLQMLKINILQNLSFLFYLLSQKAFNQSCIVQAHCLFTNLAIFISFLSHLLVLIY